MRATLKVRVVPNAKRSEVVGAHGDAVKVKVAAPALDGKANAALLEFLATKLEVPPRMLTLLRGEKSRDKVIAVDEMDEVEARRRLGV